MSGRAIELSGRQVVRIVAGLAGAEARRERIRRRIEIVAGLCCIPVVIYGVWKVVTILIGG